MELRIEDGIVIIEYNGKRLVISEQMYEEIKPQLEKLEGSK